MKMISGYLSIEKTHYWHSFELRSPYFSISKSLKSKAIHLLASVFIIQVQFDCGGYIAEPYFACEYKTSSVRVA
jgi:hypothetical protein